MSSQSNAANQLAKQNCQEVLGYLPKRGDFEQEYDMDAELLLADMEFFEDDTPENIELKNSVIELYNGRLDERIRRKKFVSSMFSGVSSSKNSMSARSSSASMSYS